MLNAPLKFMGWLDRPAERGALVIKIGLMLYDAYTGQDQTVPRHEFQMRRESLRRYPDLNPDVICTATYYDGAIPSPERLCYEVLEDGLSAGAHARALNYVRAVDAGGDTVTLLDEESGEKIKVKPRIVVNAAGPWIDFVNGALGENTRFIGGTKGSHLVLDHPELRAAIGEHEFFFENDDGRIVLIFPFRDRVLIGTSDIPIDDPEDARCTEEEVDYFLEMIAKVFPQIEVNRSHIVYRFSGVRPLPTGDADNPGQISRDHSIKTVEAGNGFDFPILSLIGGKWTTFRAFAEDAADAVLERVGRERQISTRDRAIGGGRDYPRGEVARKQYLRRLQEASGLSYERARDLFERYGTGATEVAAFLAEGEDAPLTSEPSYSRREVAYLAQKELVVHLDDLLLRRTLLGMLGRLNRELVEETAGIVGEALGWSQEETETELERTRKLLADEHQLSV
jgi:glycerol-3-phosphate dehydrogenase